MTHGRVLAAVAAASVAAVIGIQAIGAPSESIGLVMTAMFGTLGLSPLIRDHLRARTGHQPKPSAATTIGISGIDLYWSPFAVLVAEVAALQVVERVTAGFVAFAAAWGQESAGLVADDPRLVSAALVAGGLVSVMVQAVVMIPLAYWAAHRLERRSFAWILAGIVLSYALSIIVLQLVIGFDSPGGVLQVFAISVVLVPGAALGTWLGERSKLDYGMSLIYGRLAVRDQVDLLEMARHAGESATGPKGELPAGLDNDAADDAAGGS